MNWKEYKKSLLKNPEFAKEYRALALEYELARSAVELRIQKGLTQEKLAELVGTRQSGIARLESGRSKPSIAFLEKVAKALDADLIVKLSPKKRHRKREAS